MAKQPPRPTTTTTDPNASETFEQAFERMGREDAAETPPVAVAPAAEEGVEEVETPAAAPTPEELLANLSPEQRAYMDKLNANLKDAEHRASTDAGRVSALTRKLNEMTRPAPTAAGGEPTPAQPSQAQVDAALAGDAESMKALEEDYPAIAKVVKDLNSRTAAALARVREDTRKEMRDIVNPLLQRFETDDEAREVTHIQAQVKTLTEAHGDWQQVKVDPQFKAWLGTQPPGIQALIGSRDARDAIHVLDLYKGTQSADDVSQVQARREKRLQQAAAVPGVSGRAAQQSRQAEVPNEYNAAWDAYGRQRAAGKK